LLPSGSDSRVKILGIGLLQWNVFSLSALAADSFFVPRFWNGCDGGGTPAGERKEGRREE